MPHRKRWGSIFFVSDGENRVNSGIQFPYLAPCFKGNAMEIRESLYWGQFSQCQNRIPESHLKGRGCGVHL